MALTLLGFLTANLVGSRLVSFGESLLSRMPIVRPIYRTTKQIFETLFSSSDSSFRHVGLVEFPAPGMWSLVFLTQSPTAQIAAHLPETEHVSAFMPCTPNPTTGFFFYVPRRDVIDLDITVEQAMTLLISAGIIQPGGDPQNKLAALAETARAAQAGAQGGAEPRGTKRSTRRSDLASLPCYHVSENQSDSGGGSMNFGQAISSGFSNYVNFSGRAVRSEYWYWVLFVVLGEDGDVDHR